MSLSRIGKCPSSPSTRRIAWRALLWRERFHITYTSSGESAEAPGTIDYGDILTDAKGEIRLHEQGKRLYPGAYTVTEVEPAPGFQMKEPSTQKIILHGSEQDPDLPEYSAECHCC